MSRVEPRRVEEKAAYVRGELAFLRTLPADVDAERNPAEARAARYSLQAAVTALTDLAYHLCAKRLHHAPQNARDAFRHLAAAGAFPEPLMEKVSAMVGFRNLAVYGYEVFDDRELSRVLATDLGDAESLMDSLVAYAARP
jgi:uncharacterized protein YutE (UPF0331/DUF86 family)